MSSRNFWAQEAQAIKKDRKKVVVVEELFKEPQGVRQNEPIKTCEDTWGTNDLSKVISLEVDNHIYNNINGHWSTVKSKWALVLKEFEGVKANQWSSIPQSEQTIVLNIMKADVDPQSPWNYIIRQINDIYFIPMNYAYNADGHKVAYNKHIELLSKISHQYLSDFKKNLNDFRDSLGKYNADKSKIESGFIFQLLAYKEEIENDAKTNGYNRFDKFYLNETTAKILKAIETKYKMKFTPAEIKALQMKETGDFTNNKIAGIDDKKKGIIHGVSSSGAGIVGICQLPEESANEAVKWARDNAGVTIGNDRKIPEQAVYLTAAYIGRTIELLKQTITFGNDCLTKKMIVFGSYNAGHKPFKDAIEKYVESRKKLKKETNIIFDSSDFQIFFMKEVKSIYKDKANSKYKEVKDYLNFIVKRLQIISRV